MKEQLNYITINFNMLYKPKRPWDIPKNYNTPGQGRKLVTKFYHSKAWKKMRHAFIAGKSTHLPGLDEHINRFCWICALDGIINKAHTVDHIKPINRQNPFDTQNGKYGDPLSWTNLGSLCKHHTMLKNAIERNYGMIPIDQVINKLRLKQY